MARVDWIGRGDIAEALINSIQPDDPDCFRCEITEIDAGVKPVSYTHLTLPTIALV